jgi:CheY-like chemotaxis protein
LKVLVGQLSRSRRGKGNASLQRKAPFASLKATTEPNWTPMPQKVLVVDDDPIMHRVLGHYLGRKGYQMINASSGRQAIELANRELPQLIVLDVRMPEMSGLAALRQLKESESTKNIPVIVVTVNSDRLTHMESEISGAAAFLAKPFRPAQLLEEIKRLLPAEDEPKAAEDQK